MIALVTSTLIPNENAYSRYSDKERIEQTKTTIDALLQLNFIQIFIFDNSKVKTTLATLSLSSTVEDKVYFFHNYQYSFENKGINEALLILNNISNLPKNIPIFKISARYYPTTAFNLNKFEISKDIDFIGLGYNMSNKQKYTISTRAYAIRNSSLLEQLLTDSIEDIYTYSLQKIDIKSLLKRLFRNRNSYYFKISIEHSFARILNKDFNYILRKELNIEGYIAGSKEIELIKE